MLFNELNQAQCLISAVEFKMKEKSRCSSEVKRPEAGGKRPTHRYWPNSAVESYFTQESGTSDLTERAKYFYLFEDEGHNRNVTGAEGEQYECQWSGLDVPRVRGLGLTGRGQSLGNFHMFTWWVLRLSTGWCLPRILSNWGRKAITRDHTHHFSQAGISPLLPL